MLFFVISEDLQYGLESALEGIEESRAQLKKLADYATTDMFIDEIVCRLLDIEDVLGKAVGCSWSAYCGADESDMEELELEAYLDYHHPEGQTDAEWAVENDVDWDEVEDRRMN
jgi:hypothetical protein